MNFKTELNEQQYEAVTTSSQHARVIAGAGSGKTRVLTYRIAYLLSEMRVQPWKILAITFTNKVANEMLTRIGKLLPEYKDKMTIKTFHSFAAMFLRREISALGFPSNFTILDEEDQTKVIKDIASDMGYKKSDPFVKRAIGYIANNKLKAKYPGDITIKYESFEGEKHCLELYERYEETKDKMYALDFDDLLLKTNIILESFPSIRMKWQQNIDYILVDEFQDTNDVEYKLIRLLFKPETSLYVVGDPDQTIYTWRGANQNIILNIEKEFPYVETIILNRNYRSTASILNSANKLIARNKERVKKDLFTKNGDGDPVNVRSNSSAKWEAETVAKEIRRLKEIGGYQYKDIVILYRSNYITMEFESSLTVQGIPYVIYGGTKFYQRREIKDVLAYFRLIVNEKDDVSFERIINVPKRGVGDTSINNLKKEAADHNLSLYEYVASPLSDDSASRKAVAALRNVIVQINKTREDIKTDDEVFSKPLEDLISSIGYYDALIKEDDGDERIENVKALFQDLRYYLKSHPDSSFDEYLQNIALMSSQDEMVDGDHITLMTVHTAKGLEFPVVFLVRFNDGVFPNQRAMEEGGFKAMEEERRLAYVAITRAKEKLYVSYAGGYSYVTRSELQMSMFIAEAGLAPTTQTSSFSNGYSSYGNNPFSPKRNLYNNKDFFGDGPTSGFTSQEVIRQNFNDEPTNNVSWKVGDKVIHTKFGEGVVTAVDDDIIDVEFKEFGTKSLMANHKSLSKGGNN